MPLKRQKKTREPHWFKSLCRFATKNDLRIWGLAIMSKISEFSDRQKAFNDRQSAAVDGLVADVKALNDKITELQNTAGEITPEDQALLDDIEARSKAVTDKLEALDAQTPPVVPT